MGMRTSLFFFIVFSPFLEGKSPDARGANRENMRKRKKQASFMQ